MKDYIEKKDLKGLRTAISAVEKSGFVHHLARELAHAKSSLKMLQMPTRKSPLLAKRRKRNSIDIPLAELYPCREPPPIVHRLFVALLLLMGVNEGITKVCIFIK